MDELARILDGSLSADGTIRSQCNDELTTRLSSPGFALQLSAFILNETSLPFAIRQLSCILMKKLVTSYWVPNSSEEDDADGIKRYIVGDTEKQQVRHAMLTSIQHPELLASFADSKLQTALCMVITAIFERDGPEQWPEILPVMITMIHSTNDNNNYVAFVIRFLALAIPHFSNDHCSELVVRIFPKLQEVFSNPHLSIAVRTRIVRIVETSLLMVGMEAHVGNRDAQQLLQTNMTHWIELFLAHVHHPPSALEYGLTIQILHSFTAFIEEWPNHMSAILPHLLPRLYILLRDGVVSFDHEQLGPDAIDVQEEEDEEGSVISHTALVIATFECLKSTLHAPTKSTRRLINAHLAEFVTMMITYMQITTHHMMEWTQAPNTYVADEDDESMGAYTIRNAGIDVLNELESVLGRPAVVAMVQAVHQRLEEETTRTTGWRVQEASLVVVGTLATAILKNPSAQSTLQLGTSFVPRLFHMMTSVDSTIYLRARALWCASKLATALDTNQFQMLFQLAIAGLDTQQELPVRLYACRTIGTIVRLDRVSEVSQLQDQNVVVHLLERLMNVAEHSSQETLHIVLETLVIVLQELGQHLVPIQAHGQGIVNATITSLLTHWTRQLNDPLVAEFLDSGLNALLELDDIDLITQIHHQVLPVLQKMLIQARNDLTAAGHGVTIAASALTVLKTLVKHAFVASTADTSLAARLAQPIVALVFEPLIAILDAVEEESVLNTGAECLKWLVMFAVESLRQYQTQLGGNGVDVTMNIAAKLLSPTVDDTCGVCVGGLITQMLLVLGAQLPTTTIQSILVAVGHRLATAQLPSLIQSLCMVFARLVHTHGQQLLNVLEQLPAPVVNNESRKNLLEFVFATWIEQQMDFYGLYCVKVTISALLKVAEWNDPRVMQLQVRGSPVVSSSSARQTRSTSSALYRRTSQLQMSTRVHFLTKLIVVLATVSTQLSEEEEEWVSSEEEEEEDEDEDEDDVKHTDPSSFAPAELLSDRLDGTGPFADEDHVSGDPDVEFEAQLDPLNELNLKVLIPNALQSFTSNVDMVQALLPELTEADKSVLGSVSSGQ